MTILPKFNKYLADNKISAPTSWGLNYKISKSVMSRFLKGKKLSASNALKIENATDKFITMNEILKEQLKT